MNQTHYTSQTRDRYLEEISKVAAARQEVEVQLGRLQEVGGSPDPVHEALQELNLRTKELEQVREQIGPVSTFLASLAVEVTKDRTISFVIPRGLARYEILQEAEVLNALHFPETRLRSIMRSTALERWRKDMRFRAIASQPEYRCIQGVFPGSEGLSSAAQRDLLATKGLCHPGMEDLAVACVLFFVATRQSLFETLFETEPPRGKQTAKRYIVCAADAELVFTPLGLTDTSAKSGSLDLAAAALLAKS
jgi:hypothetical protein